MVLFWFIILSFLLAVNANLSPNYPVNAQIPPVARVSQPYKFVFSQGTFADSNKSTKYSLENAPSWLHVDSEKRALTGTPQSGDDGEKKFDLVASNDSESAKMEVTLVVSTNEGPKPGKPLLPQLEKTGPTSAPSTIFVHAGDSFSISFDDETFTNTSPDTIYYGTSPDNSPLPSWMQFDESELKFTGSSPPFGPQTFAFHLIASDVNGYSAATLTFKITISPHVLAFNNSLQTFELTPGKKFSSPHFIDMLRLDGNAPASSDLDKIDVDSPDWLELDKETISLTGTPPDDASNKNVTVTVTDTYGNIANLIINLDFSHLFAKHLKDCNANVGEDFNCVLDSILTDDAAQLHVDIGQQLSSWLKYNPDNQTLHGHVPANIDPKLYEIELTATQGSTKATKRFSVNVAEAGHHEENADKVDDDSDGGGLHNKKSRIIAISVVIPVIFLISVVLFLCCARRKRQTCKAAAHVESQTDEKPFRPDRPDRLDAATLPHCQPFEETIAGVTPDRHRSTSLSSKPPKLELDGPLWSVATYEKKESLENEADKENAFSPSTIDWDFASLKAPGPKPEEPKPNPNPETSTPQNKRLSFQSSPPARRTTAQSKRREPLKHIQPRRSLKRNSAASSRRCSKRSSGISSVASGLPIRLSGAGHGAGGFGPPGHGVVQMSWQNNRASFQSEESGVENLAPLFPRPSPRARESYQKRISLRAVEPDTSSESDSLETFIHGRAKSRNSSNPMFSGQGNRRRSSGIRALERHRSNASRADTVSTWTSDYTQSIQGRPYSTAMASSIYDDNRQSAYRPLSQVSNMQPPLAPWAEAPSQSSLAQTYTDMITPLPRFFSEASLASGRRMEGEVAEQPVNNYERPDTGSQRRRYRGNPYTQNDPTRPRRYGSLRKSPSLSSIPTEGKGRRVSLVRFADKENEPMDRWRVGENQDRRPVSIENHGLQRDLRGSLSGDMTFV